jgi:hypothetical protein
MAAIVAVMTENKGRCLRHRLRTGPHELLKLVLAERLLFFLCQSVRRGAHDAPDAILIADAADLAVGEIDLDHVLR